MDHEDHQKKIQPGECCVVNKNLPNGLITKESKSNFENFKLLREIHKLHYYFY